MSLKGDEFETMDKFDKRIEELLGQTSPKKGKASLSTGLKD